MPEPPALEVQGLCKTFLGQRALSGVSMALAPGEIRGLVGQNGSGKSTLIKVLAGFYTPDDGAEITVAGRRLATGSARASERLGLRFVHQDLGLIATIDTAENLAVGTGFAGGRRRLIRWKREHREAREQLGRLGYQIDTRRPVGDLAASERTAVAVARALSTRPGEASVLVLDEPTANLPAVEADRLFDTVRKVASRGIAVLLVSHHLEEVFEVCESVTVLRNGRLVGTHRSHDVDHDDLIEMMVGERLAEFEAGPRVETDDTDVVLQVRGLSSAVLHDVSFSVRSGEIVGVAGLTGSGRERIGPALFGGVPSEGSVVVNGDDVPRGRPGAAIRHSVAFVPADRHVNAAFLDSTVADNITIVGTRTDRRMGFIRRGYERGQVDEWLQRLDVRPARGNVGLATLSGGNQQKVMLARWLRRRPDLLILDEPTQGVDVGAKADIHELIDDTAAQGTAVLVVSTDHEELARLCRRVLVFVAGRLTTQLHDQQITAERITAATSRISAAEVEATSDSADAGPAAASTDVKGDGHP